MKWTGPDCVGSRLLAVGLVAFAGCGGGGDGDACELIAAWDEVAAAPAGAALEVAVACVDAGGTPRPGEARLASVAAGGGGLASEASVAGPDGRAVFTWTMVVIPVDQRLVVRRVAAAEEPGPGDEISFTMRATLDAPYVPTPFGDVEDVLATAGIDGTTEGLAFSDDGLVLAVPGHLVTVDSQGTATVAAPTGDPLDGPLGLAVDDDGLLWVADAAGGALRTVDPDGVVLTVLTTDGDGPLGQPNDVKIGPDGAVWLSDPCLGKILRYDVATQAVQVVATFDLATQGGPNGLAFDADGALWATTENVGLLCMNGDVDMLAPVAGLVRIDPAWAQEPDPAARARPVLEAVALFGDGLAFDAEGNLYVLFDRIDTGNLVLEASELHVIAAADLAAFLGQPAAGAEPPQTAVLLSSPDVVMANLAWGRGTFESNRIHLSLLAIPAFGLTTRGIVTFDAGIPGM
jgi:DNA-binding beta-propeller fold protein YncE